jgi:hypothetical protein
MERRQFLKSAAVTGGLMAAWPSVLSFADQPHDDFPLTDLHVHLTPTFTIDHVMDIAKRTGVQFGIMVNPGAEVHDDASLRHFIESLKPYPVYCGLQPMSPGWSKSFSPEAIKLVDYVEMDSQTIPNGNGYGETLRIWNFDTYVDDPQKFMEIYMAHNLEVINNPEPLRIFGWPLFLPVCIARDYYTLWTDKRMQAIIDALKKRNIAVEINDMSHTPHEKFILMAKGAGLKFTFGSDSRNQIVGRLDYCKYIAKKCNLKREDFFIPKRALSNVF